MQSVISHIINYMITYEEMPDQVGHDEGVLDSSLRSE